MVEGDQRQCSVPVEVLYSKEFRRASRSDAVMAGAAELPPNVPAAFWKLASLVLIELDPPLDSSALD